MPRTLDVSRHWTAFHNTEFVTYERRNPAGLLEVSYADVLALKDDTGDTARLGRAGGEVSEAPWDLRPSDLPDGFRVLEGDRLVRASGQVWVVVGQAKLEVWATSWRLVARKLEGAA